MNKYKWIFERWKLFQHPKEEIYRIKQQMQYHIVDRDWVNHPPMEKHFEFYNPFGGKYSLEGLQQVIPKLLNNYHAFKILNVTIPDIISHDKWNYDIKNRVEGTTSFLHKITDFDYSNGEIKYIYELSRLYHLPQLGAYAVVAKQDMLMHTLFEQIRDWYSDNQFLKTIAWKSGNVVGIRVINLILFRIIIDMTNRQYHDLSDFTSFFDQLIELHFKFLISHLSLYSSRGNHFLGEIAGIIAICSVYKFKKSNKYLKKYFSELCSELLRLIHEDGFNKEQATRYQASYINLFITSYQFAKEQGCVLHEKVQSRLESMYIFLAELRISDKQFFSIGDDDAAQLIYPYADINYNIYESMLNDLEILYGTRIERNYHFDLRNYLLFGDDGYNTYQKNGQQFEEIERIKKDEIKVSLYEKSGYFLIKDKNINFLFDVGLIGLWPGMTHGHSDILSIYLYYKNMPILVDTGTYQYNNHYKKYHDYFHGTFSHNTIAVNHEDQAIQSEGMFWLTSPNVKIETYDLNPDNPCCVASHDGYVRKKYQVIHRRKAEYRTRENKILITDKIQGKGKNRIDYSLHFHPEINLELRDNTLFILNKECPIKICNKYFHLGTFYKGNEILPKGWYSPSYDDIEASCTFVLAKDIDDDFEMETEISF